MPGACDLAVLAADAVYVRVLLRVCLASMSIETASVRVLLL
jgi:hypothetical protein